MAVYISEQLGAPCRLKLTAPPVTPPTHLPTGPPLCSTPPQGCCSSIPALSSPPSLPLSLRPSVPPHSSQSWLCSALPPTCQPRLCDHCHFFSSSLIPPRHPLVFPSASSICFVETSSARRHSPWNGLGRCCGLPSMVASTTRLPLPPHNPLDPHMPPSPPPAPNSPKAPRPHFPMRGSPLGSQAEFESSCSFNHRELFTTLPQMSARLTRLAEIQWFLQGWKTRAGVEQGEYRV